MLHIVNEFVVTHPYWCVGAGLIIGWGVAMLVVMVSFMGMRI